MIFRKWLKLGLMLGGKKMAMGIKMFLLKLKIKFLLKFLMTLLLVLSLKNSLGFL